MQLAFFWVKQFCTTTGKQKRNWQRAILLIMLGAAGGTLRAQTADLSTTPPAAPIRTDTQVEAETSHTATGSLITFTVHVHPADGNAAATGTVTLIDGAQQVGSAALDAEGKAQIATSNLLPGTHNIHALYSGSGSLKSSFSPEAEVTAEASGVATFAVAASPAALTVAQGKAVSSIITLTPQNSFSGYVTLSCFNVTPGATCSFTPGNVFVGGTANSVSTLSVTTVGPTTVTSNTDNRAHGTSLAFLLVPGLFSLAALRRNRRWQQLGLVLLVTVGACTDIGCSQRYNYLKRNPAASPGATLGNSTFAIEAQSISGAVVITQQISVSLTVTAP